MLRIEECSGRTKYKMRRIRVAMLATNLELNGISSVIMNYVRYLDLSKYNLTIIAGKSIEEKYRLECNDRGVNIIELPHRLDDTKGYYYNLYKSLKKGNFDIFHVHGSSATLAIDLMIAKLAGIKLRIAHSHNTTTNNMKLHKILTPIFKVLYTKGFACGIAAGKWLFGNRDFVVIPNGFDVKKFMYSKKARDKFRENNNLENTIVLGHVGRFNRQKNHPFILKVFDELIKLNSKYRLLLVGNGPDFNKVQSLIEKSQNSDKIILYGETINPSDVYMAMDKFILPSLYEGLPVVLLEAQISGLPAIVSNVVTSEVKMTDNLIFESLKNSPKKWAKSIDSLNTTDEERRKFFSNNKNIIMNYEVEKSVKILENEYDKITKALLRNE